jgi:hypothetical protein
VLITEVVTVSDAPSSPEAIRRKPEPRRTPSPAARLARSLAAPLQRVAEAVTPAPSHPPPASTPATPEMPPPVASAAPGAGMTASTEPVAAPGPPPGAPGGTAAPPPSPRRPRWPRCPAVTPALERSRKARGRRAATRWRPSYPSSALRQGIQGTTMLKVHVLVDGRVGDVLVQQSAGHPISTRPPSRRCGGGASSRAARQRSRGHVGPASRPVPDQIEERLMRYRMLLPVAAAAVAVAAALAGLGRSRRPRKAARAGELSLGPRFELTHAGTSHEMHLSGVAVAAARGRKRAASPGRRGGAGQTSSTWPGSARASRSRRV